MCHQCRISPVPWLGCPYISKVTMTSVMTMTLTTMSLSATTTKMPGTIVTEGSCEACCQRDGHPSTFPLIMCIIWFSDAWPGLMGPVANARGIKFHLRELSPETGGQYTGMPVGDVVRSLSLGVRYHGPCWSQLDTLAFRQGRETVHGTLRTLRMLKLQWTTCFPPSPELGAWLKCGRHRKVGWEVCRLSHSVMGITTCSWSSTTQPTTVGPRNCLGFVTFPLTRCLLLWCSPLPRPRTLTTTEMVNIVKKGSCYVPPHQKVGLLGRLQLPASQWVQLCQVSKDLWRACLPGRKIFLSLWICGRSGLSAWSPATLCGLLLLTACREYPGRGPWVGSWSTELCWAVLALAMQGHDLASRSAGTF